MSADALKMLANQKRAEIQCSLPENVHATVILARYDSQINRYVAFSSAADRAEFYEMLVNIVNGASGG